MCPGVWRHTDSLGFSEGWLEQKWKGCLIQNFLVFPLPPCNELCAGLFSQVLLSRDKYRAGGWPYCVSHPIVVLYPWWRHYCLGPRMGPGPAPEPGFLIRPSEPIVPSHPRTKVKEGVAFTRDAINQDQIPYSSLSFSISVPTQNDGGSNKTVTCLCHPTYENRLGLSLAGLLMCQAWPVPILFPACSSFSSLVPVCCLPAMDCREKKCLGTLVSLIPGSD